MAKRVVVQIICDKCEWMSESKDDMYHYKIEYQAWNFDLDLCGDCAEQLDQWTALSKEATKSGRKRKGAPIELPADGSLTCPTCGFGGKNAHSLRTHQARLGHR